MLRDCCTGILVVQTENRHWMIQYMFCFGLLINKGLFSWIYTVYIHASYSLSIVLMRYFIKCELCVLVWLVINIRDLDHVFFLRIKYMWNLGEHLSLT